MWAIATMVWAMVASSMFGDDVVDEGAVDLEAVDREALEVGEAGIARSEIVRRELEAQLLALGEQAAGMFRIAHHQAFGEFQVQIGRRQTALGESRLDGVEQAGIVELTGREVERRWARGRCLPAARPDSGGRLRVAPRRRWARLGHTLRRWGWVVGWNHAAVGLAPADQGFHAEQVSAGQGVHLGLIEERELVLFDGMAQAVFQFEAFAVALGEA